METIPFFLTMSAMIIVPIWFFLYLPAHMAYARNRSAIGWIILNALFPVFALILLVIVGNAQFKDIAR